MGLVDREQSVNKVLYVVKKNRSSNT